MSAFSSALSSPRSPRRYYESWKIHVGTINPFENNPPPLKTPWNMVKLAFVAVFIFWLRVLYCGVVFVITPPMYFLSIWGVLHPESTLEPSARWRKLVGYPAVCAVSRCLLFWAGVWWVKITKDGESAPGSVYISNHVTMLEALFFAYWIRPSFIAKSALRRNWPVGPSNVCLRSLHLDRDSVASKRHHVQELKKRGLKPAAWPPLFVFPEGTNTNGQCLIKFNKGAFLPGLPVTPYIVRFPHRNYNPAATGRNCGFGPFLRMSFMVYNQMEVIQMKSYFPSEEEKKNPDVYARNVRESMAQRAGLPTTEHGYEDFLLFELYMKAGIRQTFMFTDTYDHLGLQVHQLWWLTVKLMDLDKSRSPKKGALNFEEFCSLLKTSKDELYVKDLFAIFDEDEDGLLDYEELLKMIWILTSYSEGPFEDHHLVAFKLMGGDSFGISFQTVKEFLDMEGSVSGKALKDLSDSFLSFGKTKDELLDFTGFTAVAELVEQAHVVDCPMKIAIRKCQPFVEFFEQARSLEKDDRVRRNAEKMGQRLNEYLRKKKML